MLESMDIRIPVQKTDSELGLVFGWGSVADVDGELYTDTQGDQIVEKALVEAAADFGTGTALDSHAGDPVGQVTVFPLTADIAKSLGISTEKTGLLAMMKPSPDVFAKFQSGEYTGFSIGGEVTSIEE